MDRTRVTGIIDELTALESGAFSMLIADAEKIRAATSRVGLSWSGSTLGHHAEMYYERFQRPPRECTFNAEWGTQLGWPDGWFTPTVEETEAEIRRLSSVDLGGWKAQYEEMMSRFRDLRDALVVEIPNKTMYADPRFARMVSDVEAASFDDFPAKEYLRQQINAHRASVSRDLRALSAGGVALPTHLCYEALVEGIRYAQKALAKLIKDAHLLLRYINVHEESNVAKTSAEAHMMLQNLTNDPFILRKADGTAHTFRGHISDNILITFESTLPCTEGDTVEHDLPSGQTDRFEILDTGFQPAHPPIGPHFQMKVRKVTDRVVRSLHRPSVTNIYNVHGPNARFNSESVDQSHNVVSVGEGELFQKLKEAIQAASADVTERERLLLAVDEMSAHAGKSTFAEKFQNFMALASNCVTIITPFLPALATLAASVNR